MEDEIYETGELNTYQLENLKMFLDEEIGTEYEEDFFENDDGALRYTVTIFDLTPKEVKKIRDFENTRLDEPYEKFCVVFGDRRSPTPLRSEFLSDYLKAEELLASINGHFGSEEGERLLWGYVETSRKSEQYEKLDGTNLFKQAINIDTALAVKKGGEDFISRAEKALLKTYYVSEFHEERGVMSGGEIYEINGLYGFGYENEICKLSESLVEDGFIKNLQDYQGMLDYVQQNMGLLKEVKALYSSCEDAEKALELLLENYHENKALLVATLADGEQKQDLDQ